MKRVVGLAIAVAAVVAGVATAASQAKPSFAGKWTLVPGSTAVTGVDLLFAVVQDDKTLTVVRNNGTHKRVFNLDGSEAKDAITAEPWGSVGDSSTVAWDGAKMILTMREGRRLVMTQTWSLDATGNLIIESTSNVGGTPSTTKATYKKG